MALAKKCDRCGNLYEPKDINVCGVFGNGLRLISRNEQNTMALSRRNFDLCPRCLVSFGEWFKNEPVHLTFNDIRRAVGLEPIIESDKPFGQLYSEKEKKEDAEN